MGEAFKGCDVRIIREVTQMVIKIIWLLLSLLFLFSGLNTLKEEKKKYTQVIMAKCISVLNVGQEKALRGQRMRRGEYGYQAVFEFEYGGKVHRSKEFMGSNDVLEVGKMYKIRFDPNDPEQIYTGNDRKLAVAFLVGGVIGLFLGVKSLCLYLR